MYEKAEALAEDPMTVKDRTYVVIDAIEHAEKMVNVSYEALLTLKERLSSVMCDCPPTAVPASEGRETCSMSLRIYNVGDTAENIFDDIMDTINRLEF